ncbi:non-homologous end joining protein Ku [Peribacillus deserti]|uniref:Non-homologous end joining protein Ku n=1 Tax=Peribacillus deserti TaxID=673318 RepID=A0A2N5M8N6_9BACI|nr:Ku protein [Peribacillus deserti]PLT30663.1 Ku protein [Peribacillus deserti]
MHTIWKGSISFGLVNIPIRLHSATEDKDISLRTLHKECHTPIKYEKVCPVCNKQVEKEELVKAFEYTKGKFVVLEDKELEELKKVNEAKAVEIVDFVKIEEIDPIYFMRSYYLSPNEGGGKAYTLLRKALQESQKVGIAKIVIRSKEQLAVVRVFENTLLMETIYFPDEVRAASDVPNVPAETDVSKRELDTAIMLIDQLTTEFEPGKYHDDYRTALMELIESKKNGETVIPKERDVPESNVMDLMAALQASIDKTKGDEPKKPAAKKKRAAPAKVKKKA